MRRIIFRNALLFGLLLAWPAASAEPDRYDFYAHGETHAELFRRALLPGPRGAVVRTETIAPLHQYLLLKVSDLDTLQAALCADRVGKELRASVARGGVLLESAVTIGERPRRHC